MKRFLIFVAILFPILSQANTIIQYNPTQGNTQQTFVLINYCQSGTINWIGCAGGIPLQINPNQQLNIENTCAISVTGTAYQVSVFTPTTVNQSCLTTNRVGTIKQTNPNSAFVLSGGFYGNGTSCGTSCG